MTDFNLLYWSVPFRGQFVRAALSYADASWTEVDDGQIAAMMEGSVSKMPVPFMGPPVLVDNVSGFAVSQMPAIMLYLGERFELLPASAERRALAIKVVNDANDVIDELTLDGGKQMWTDERWTQSAPRFEKWMRLWEELGARNGLTAGSGYLLGGRKPDVADIATAVLWNTIADRFSKLETLLEQNAPRTLALARRLSAEPKLAALNEKARAEYGDDYAGGQIGASMAKVLD